MSLKYTPVTQSKLCLIFLMYAATVNYCGEDSKHILQFMILKYLWPWNKVKVIKTGKNS